MFDKARNTAIREALYTESLLLRIVRSQRRCFVYAKLCLQNASEAAFQANFICESQWEETS